LNGDLFFFFPKMVDGFKPTPRPLPEGRGRTHAADVMQLLRKLQYIDAEKPWGDSYSPFSRKGCMGRAAHFKGPPKNRHEPAEIHNIICTIIALYTREII
jgi:hypothetical protein